MPRRRTTKARGVSRPLPRATHGHAGHHHREFDGQGITANLGGFGGALAGGLYTPFAPNIGAAVGGYAGYKVGQAGEAVGGIAADAVRVPYNMIRKPYNMIRGGYDYMYGMQELKDDPGINLLCANDMCDGPQAIHRRRVSPTIDVIFMSPSGYVLGVMPHV
jgi:hypothetical protein